MTTSRAIPVEEAVDSRRYRLRAELPGLDPGTDLWLVCTGTELRIDVVRTPQPRPGSGHSEFSYGRRFRVVPLPPGLRSRTVAARYVDGVLEVTAAVGVVEPRTPAFAVAVGDDPSSVPTTRDFRP
jgi:HSP20 family molecular chaperone IbpA